MARSTDYYDKFVRKHRAELCASLLAIQLKLKASFIWEFTDENCRQIYDRLNQLKIESFPTGGVDDLSFGAISVIELACSGSAGADSYADGNNILTFFGSIPFILLNIDNILVELENCFLHNNEDTEFTGDANCNIIDVSATLTEPKLLRNKEELLRRKDLLLHMKDYLAKNIDSKYLDAGNFKDNLYLDNNQLIINNRDLDLCFIAGVFLGYPVIYCNSTPDIGNCLSYKELHNYSVKSASSTPVASNSAFVLYSFSIPQMFADRYQTRVNQWFNQLLSRTAQSTSHQTEPHQLRLALCESIDTYPLILT